MRHAWFCQKFHYGGFSFDGGSLGNRKIYRLAVSISLPTTYVAKEGNNCGSLSLSLRGMLSSIIEIL